MRKNNNTYFKNAGLVANQVELTAINSVGEICPKFEYVKCAFWSSS
jgi:hypothetical protein